MPDTSSSHKSPKPEETGRVQNPAESSDSDAQFGRPESTLQTIFRAAPIGIGLVTNRVLGWVNDRLCSMLGREHEELEGKNARILYASEEEYARVGRIKHPIVLQYGTGSVETQFVHKDGHTLDVLLSSSTMVPGDMSAGLIFTVMDLSAWKAAEAERDRLFNISVDLLCISGLDGYIKQVNPSFERVLGWSPDEMMSRPWLDFVHPDDVLSTQMAGQRLKEGVPAISFTNRYRCRDGSYRWLSWNTLPLPKEGIAFAIARDITDAKLADDALRRSQRELLVNNRIITAFLTTPDEQVYKAVLEVVLEMLESPCGFFGYINENGDLVCPAIIKQTDAGGITAEKSIYPPESWSGVWCQAIEALQTVSGDDPHAIPNCPASQRYAMATPVRYQDKAIGLICIADKRGGYNEDDSRLLESVASQVAPVLHARLRAIQNEHERHRAEQERADLEEHMRHVQKMEAIGQLAGGLAHDFNNLLQVISGNIELLKNDLPKIPSVQETLAEILQASGRATSLVRQLLAFSRRAPLQFESVDLDDIIGNLLKMLRRVLGEDIELIVQGGANLRRVLADSGQIEQVLINLCVNARDAMPHGGRIQIKTENVTLDRSFCRANLDAREGDFVLLSISDTGVGIPVEVQERVFEPFFTTKNVGEGTGLGLAIVYAISKRHNGFVLMSSKPGEGTSMSVYLPADLSLTASSERESTSTQAEADGGNETILLAEDDSQVRGLATRILERAGYRLFVAEDGEEALRIFRMHPQEIDLAILDVIMPKQNGYAVSVEILRDRPDLPVFFCSGYSYSELDGRRLPTNCLPILQKPYDRNTLLRTVRQALNRNNPASFFSKETC